MRRKIKFLVIAILFSLSQPFYSMGQGFRLHQTPMVPEEFRILKNEYASIVIAFYMEQCVRNLYRALVQNGIQVPLARVGSFQICGCAMDTMRSDMPEKDYMEMLNDRTQMYSALMESNLKVCGEDYGEYYKKRHTENTEENPI